MAAKLLPREGELSSNQGVQISLKPPFRPFRNVSPCYVKQLVHSDSNYNGDEIRSLCAGILWNRRKRISQV